MVSAANATAIQPEQEHSAASAEDADRRPSWLLYRAGKHLCAVPLEHVIEILRVLPIAAIAGAPPYVRGLCIIRGTAVPVVDTGFLVGDQETKFERLITIRTGTRTIALGAETVPGIRAIGADTCNACPPLLRDAASETIAAIGTLDAELLFFLRTTLIVSQALLDRLDAQGASS